MDEQQAIGTSALGEVVTACIRDGRIVIFSDGQELISIYVSSNVPGITVQTTTYLALAVMPRATNSFSFGTIDLSDARSTKRGLK